MALYTVQPGDICLVTMFGRLDSQVIMNTFHYKWTLGLVGPDGPAELGSLIGKFRANIWTPEWQGEVTANYKLEYLQAQIIYPSRRVYSRVTVNENGTQPGTSLPSFNQVSITRFGSIAGRGRSASLQVAGLVTTQVSGSVLNDGAVAGYTGIADVIVSTQQDIDMNPDAWTPVNWTLAKATQNNPIRGATVRRQIRTEKRRVVGQGI